MNETTKAWQNLGLNATEYAKIQSLLGREPSWLELSMFAVLWSEHCSYKHSKPLLRTLPTEGKQVAVGPGENAGVLDVGADTLIVAKVESHNHPSAVEPYQGAATGVGGIIRDILAMGARPVAMLDSLRFGNPENPRVDYLMRGVVAGIGGYGNCVGVPTIGGELVFEDVYGDNPLVNAMCVGFLPKDKLTKSAAVGVGNPLFLVGSPTGRDGIHGATFASEELSEASQEKRAQVQVGDPFMEKLVIEVTLKLIDAGIVVSLQDLGAAGLTSATVEMAAKEGAGVSLDVAKVYRREESMRADEVMLSETQERMVFVLKQGSTAVAEAICEQYGVPYATIGVVSDDGHITVQDGQEVLLSVPARYFTEEAPLCPVPGVRAEAQTELQQLDLAEIQEPQDYLSVVTTLLHSPNLRSPAWAYEQYDYQVGTKTVIGPGGDGALLHIPDTDMGVAFSLDGNGRYTYLDPYIGGAQAVCEAARNVVAVGARPLGITNCLNFGNPEKPHVAWQFAEAIAGMGAACRTLDTPVTGGNVSFYNETAEQAIYPTPVVGMTGVLENIAKRVTPAFKATGEMILLIGETKAEIGGSEYLKVIHGQIKGKPPQVDLDLERKTNAFILSQMADQLFTAVHDVADGGVLVALLEMAFHGQLGFVAEITTSLRPDFFLFSESQARYLVTVSQENVAMVQERAMQVGLFTQVLGRVQADQVSVQLNQTLMMNQSLSSLRDIWL